MGRIGLLVFMTTLALFACDYFDPYEAAWLPEPPEHPEDVYRAYPAKTGQTTSYAAGDDGDLQKGVAWPSRDF